MKRDGCLHCRNFYVTWDNVHPYGCRAYGFKGREIPEISVRRLSGEPCRMFCARDDKGNGANEESSE